MLFYVQVYINLVYFETAYLRMCYIIISEAGVLLVQLNPRTTSAASSSPQQRLLYPIRVQQNAIHQNYLCNNIVFAITFLQQLISFYATTLTTLLCPELPQEMIALYIKFLSKGNRSRGPRIQEPKSHIMKHHVTTPLSSDSNVMVEPCDKFGCEVAANEKDCHMQVHVVDYKAPQPPHSRGVSPHWCLGRKPPVPKKKNLPSVSFEEKV